MDATPKTESEKRRLKAAIRAAVKLWVGRLGLGQFKIRVYFIPFGDETGYGACRCLSAYRSAVLEFDLDRFPEHEDVEQLVVHELVHMLVMPLHEHAEIGLTPKEVDVLDMQAERVVHDISVALVRLVAGKTYSEVQFPKGSADATVTDTGAGDPDTAGRKRRHRPARLRSISGRAGR